VILSLPTHKPLVSGSWYAPPSLPPPSFGTRLIEPPPTIPQVPLLRHFHPSVALHARQLLLGEPITTTPNLELHTLTHFLDRFVYRNPTKKQAKGSGGDAGLEVLQPGRRQVAGGVSLKKGAGVGEDEQMNVERFWKKKEDDVPVDQVCTFGGTVPELVFAPKLTCVFFLFQRFFHRFFNKKQAAAEAVTASHKRRSRPKAGEDEDEEDADTDDESVGDIVAEKEPGGVVPAAGSDEDEDPEEEEIWKVMKATMPGREEEESDLDDDLDDLDDDESDEDVDGVGADNGEDEDDEGFAEADSASDLVDMSDVELGGMPGEEESDDEDDVKDGRGKKRQRTKKKLKNLPVFASAEDFAHLVDAEESDD
jgi:ribosome biogenesis protein MAK21